MPHRPRTRTGECKPNYALLWRALGAQDALYTVRLATAAGASTADLWAALTGGEARAVNKKWIARRMADILSPVLRHEEDVRRHKLADRRYRERRMSHAIRGGG